MNLYTKTLTACLLFLAVQIAAQEKRTYDSSYQPLLGQSGHARFSYYLDKEGNRIKEGPFQFQSKQRDSLNPALFIYEEWKGQYAGNKKQGTWTYKKTRQWVQLEDVDEWELQYQLKTEERIIKAQYTQDFPDKVWELTRTVFLNKEAIEQTEKLKTILQNQRINGPIELFYRIDSTRSGRVSGFSRNGLMDSVWNFEVQKGDSLIREQRQYKKGFLLSLTKRWQADTITHLKYPLSQLVQASLDEGSGEDQAVNLPVSLSFSDGYPRTSEYLLAQKDANFYLEEMLRQLFQYDPGFIPTNGLPVGTNRGYYVLSSKEKNLLDKWPDLEYAYREKVNAIKAELDTSLATVNAPALTWIRNWTNRQEYIFDYIKPWNNILSRKEIEYYYRKGELIKYARALLDKDEIQTADSTLLTIAYEVPEFTTTDFLSYISSNFELRKQKADSILGELKGISREQAISREKQALIQRVQALKKEVDEQLKDSSYHASIEPLMAHLKHYFLEMEYPRRYAGFMNNLNADSITYLLESVQMIQEIAVRLPVRSSRIDSLYTIYTFDPFTFNDRFPRRIKKKLYDLIAVELYSDLLQQISINPSISEVRTGIRKLYNIQERLLFLHDKDTRKLERKLKKGSSMQDKLEVIKV